MCATCHVYLDEKHKESFPAPTDVELAMLESVVCERKEASRLGCQLIVSGDMEVTVHLPERQV
jgi:2Fe-2S ferredoxin